MTNNLCPCGSKNTYQNCCEPFISGQSNPPTAEALMRSRYSAYVKQAYQYVYDTYHPDTRKHFALDAIEEQSEHIQWLGLKITEIVAGKGNDDRGSVNFSASYKLDDGNIHYLTERSYFTKLNDKWFYVNGETRFTSTASKSDKQGRNEPCACGSGKKYKKCCGAAA